MAVRKHPTLCVHVIVIGRFAIRIGFAAECLGSSRFFPKSFWFGKQIIIQFSVETDQRDKTQGQPAHGKKIALEKKKKKKTLKGKTYFLTFFFSLDASVGWVGLALDCCEVRRFQHYYYYHYTIVCGFLPNSFPTKVGTSQTPSNVLLLLSLGSPSDNVQRKLSRRRSLAQTFIPTWKKKNAKEKTKGKTHIIAWFDSHTLQCSLLWRSEMLLKPGSLTTGKSR